MHEPRGRALRELLPREFVFLIVTDRNALFVGEAIGVWP